MRELKGSANYFHDYFRASQADSSKIWRGFGIGARYDYLATLLQWQADADDEEPAEAPQPEDA